MEHGLQRPYGRFQGARWLGATLAVAVAGLTLGGCQDPDAGGAPTRWMKPNPGGHGGVEPLPSIEARPAQVSVAVTLEKAKVHFSKLPASVDNPRNPITEDKVALGRMLYFDKRLSKNHDLSCASCHDLANYGIDIREKNGARTKTSAGHGGQMGDRNSPTVYNAGLHIAQFWDGRSRDLEDQAKGPVTNPVEMAMVDEASVVATLASIPGYVEAFGKAFPGQPNAVSYDNMANAIGAFERRLMTPGPFDEFLGGKLTALDEAQLRGLALFMDTGCIQCHVGPGLGGTEYKKLGATKDWPGLKDEGRAKVTRGPNDKFMFKVPSLRNVTETGPYLHDGSIDSLEEMVAKMAEYQLAKDEVPPDELAALVAFLGSLKGTLPTEYIAEPTLPADGPETPAPNPA